jgi:hypothetical protein
MLGDHNPFGHRDERCVARRPTRLLALLLMLHEESGEFFVGAGNTGLQVQDHP